MAFGSSWAPEPLAALPLAQLVSILWLANVGVLYEDFRSQHDCRRLSAASTALRLAYSISTRSLRGLHVPSETLTRKKF